MGNMRTLALIVIKSYKQGESFQNKNKKQKKRTTKKKTKLEKSSLLNQREVFRLIRTVDIDT